jgi:glyoxylate reductase
MKNVFIAHKLPGEPESLLKQNGFKVSTHSKNELITRDELIKKIKNADAVITLLSNKIDKEVIDAMTKCKIIANYAVGYNNIDVQYAKSKNIIVTNTPDILTDATADIAAALALTAMRRFHEGEYLMRSKKFKGWMPDLLIGMELRGKTAGIIGAGRIGQETAKRLKAFGTKIIYVSREKKNAFESETGAKKVSLNYLLKNSDIISIHLPLNDSTFHLLNSENMKLIKKSAVLVNTARGEVIDEKYLIKMLKQKKIFAAGFDVYEGEPNVNPELLELKNVYLLPHLGSASIEARSGMAQLCAKNIIHVLNGKSPVTPV